MKKVVSILAAAAVCMTMLSGCSRTVSPGDVEGYDEGEQYISLWVHIIEETPEGQAYLKSVNSFNEHYNGKYFADVEFIPRNDSGGGYSDKVNASVLSGNLPDVLTVDGPNVAAYAANGIIQPLAELTEEEKGIYLDSIIEQGTINDKLYALGAMESSVGLYYNKAILREAGIEVPEVGNPWTFSEFLDILEQLKPIMKEKNGYALDMTFPVGEATIYYYAPFVWANGGELVSEDGLTTDGYFNSDKNIETMKYFRALVENGYMSSVPIQNLFESGRAAFKFDGAWEVMGTKHGNQAVCTLVDFDEKTCSMKIGGGFQFLDYGLDLYAPQSTTDKDGRRIVVAWLRMLEPMDNNTIGMFSIPRVCEVKDGHIFFRPHPDIRAKFTRKATSPKGIYMVKASLAEGEQLDIGGYIIRKENGRIIADRTAVIRNHEELRNIFELPVLSGAAEIEAYVDRNMIEVFVNGGEYAITNAVYDLSGQVIGNAELYVMDDTEE